MRIRKAKETEPVGIASRLGPSELELLNMVWGAGGLTVRDAYEETRKTRNITLPAVMLSMNRLVKRGLLEKSASKRGAVYRPAVSRDQVASSLIGDIVNRVLQGSVSPILSHLVEKMSEGELAELRKLLKKS
jgi:BlaI family transcriptional regulator, penicillinase repressor